MRIEKEMPCIDTRPVTQYKDAVYVGRPNALNSLARDIIEKSDSDMLQKYKDLKYPVTRAMVEDNAYMENTYPGKVIKTENKIYTAEYQNKPNQKMITLKTRQDTNVYFNIDAEENGNVTLNKLPDVTVIALYSPANGTHVNVVPPEITISLSVNEVTKLYTEMRTELKRLKTERNKATRNRKRVEIKSHTTAMNYHKETLKTLKKKNA